MKKLILTASGILFVCTLFAQGIPQKISYQGKLLENGIPVNGTKNITFTIGNWSETKNNVQVTEGLYSVTLGDIPIAVFDSTSTITLQITVGADPLIPPTEILSVPYAFKAEKAVDAEKIAGYAVSTTPPNTDQVLKWDGSTSTWVPGTDDTGTGGANDWGNQTVVSDATLTGAGLSGDSLSIAQQGATTGQVLKWDDSTSTWVPGTDDTGSGGLTLPYIGTNSTGGTAFSITTNGGEAGEFITTAGSSPALAATTTSSVGQAGDFRIVNTSNSDNALYVSTTGTGRAGFFVVSNTNSNADALKVSQNGNGEALYVITTGDDNAGYFAISNTSNSVDALYVTTNGTGRAAYFGGDIFVNGIIGLPGAKPFVIDHPLDPDNKILRHFSIESPEILNMYKGRAKLVNGAKVIELPDYFDALNHPEGREINLTPVNGWSPLYLDGKIDNNQFVVKTTENGNPSQEFSWVIYAVRNDKYLQDNPIAVEQEKGVGNRFKKGESIYSN